MSTNKLALFQAALETIRDDEGVNARELATLTLAPFEVDAEADHKALVKKIADFMIADKCLFATGPELSDKLNAAGMKTARGKDWTRASVSRYLSDVRDTVQAAMSLPKPEALAVTNVTVITEAPKPAQASAPEPVVEAPVAVEPQKAEPAVATPPAADVTKVDLSPEVAAAIAAVAAAEAAEAMTDPAEDDLLAELNDLVA